MIPELESARLIGQLNEAELRELLRGISCAVIRVLAQREARRLALYSTIRNRVLQLEKSDA